MIYFVIQIDGVITPTLNWQVLSSNQTAFFMGLLKDALQIFVVEKMQSPLKFFLATNQLLCFECHAKCDKFLGKLMQKYCDSGKMSA